MSQFNLYLEKVQENRNYQDFGFNQDSKVYDEGFKEKVMITFTALGLLVGGLSFAKNKQDIDKDSRTLAHAISSVTFSSGLNPNETQMKLVYADAIKNGQLTNENIEAIRKYSGIDNIPAGKQRIEAEESLGALNAMIGSALVNKQKTGKLDENLINRISSAASIFKKNVERAGKAK